MHEFTVNMMKIVGVPRMINIKGRQVMPSILFSPALCESMLFWHAASLSKKLHDEVLLSVRVVADHSSISGARLLDVDTTFKLTESPGMGLAASLMLLSESGSKIMSPARAHRNFDYGPVIFAFRDAIRRECRDGEDLSPESVRLNTVFYDTITKPARAEMYLPDTNYAPGIKR